MYFDSPYGLAKIGTTPKNTPQRYYTTKRLIRYIYFVAFRKQQIATDKISSMITLLVNKSQDDIGVSVVTEGAENLVSAVFNILMSASYNADFRRKDAKNVADQEKVRFFLCENNTWCGHLPRPHVR